MGMLKIGKNCSVCKEWQEHCYWSHMADDSKHFLTYMVGDFTKSMVVPTRFANNFNGHISEDVNLKSPSGKTWSIGVANSDTGELVLRSGWKEFVDGNGVQEDDCLLFRYSGVSSFDVLIFDPSGCEKASPHFVENRGFGRSEKFAGAEGGGRNVDKNGHHQHQLEMTLHKKSSRCRSIPRACKRGLFSDEIEQDHRDEKEDDDEDEKDGYYFCRHGGRVTEYNLTEGDKEEISRVPVPVEPGNPVFVKVIHASHLLASRYTTVGVSPEFTGRYLGPVAREVVMERGSTGGREEWHVRFVRRECSRGFHGTGWRQFARDNGLLAHDVCLFELRMVGGGGGGLRHRSRRPTMTVHVLRRVRGRFAMYHSDKTVRVPSEGLAQCFTRLSAATSLGMVTFLGALLRYPSSLSQRESLGKNCSVCKEWQEHCYWSHMADHMNLRSPSGKTWSIGVSNSDAGELVLQSGWKEFVDGNGIEEGDSLLFRYSGVSSFDVLIFDPSGCEKASRFGRAEKFAGAEQGGRNGRRTPPIVDGDNGHHHHLEMTLHRNSGRSIPRACKRSLFSDETEQDQQENDDEDVVAAAEGSHGGYYFSRHGRISRVPVPVEPGNPVFVQVIHSSHARSSNYCIVLPLKSPPAHCTYQMAFQFPISWLKWTETVLLLFYYVIVKACRRSSPGSICGRWRGMWCWRGRAGEGSDTPCSCTGRTPAGFYGGGWRQFAGDNHLVAHDVCLFELMMMDGASRRRSRSRRPTMTVHVLRRVRGRFVLLR
uniref:TF-B3 domain-containing protein n=1 Tax=Oryza punctata TaxID=4537 RepID=A0A0E0KGE9_ORYPU